MATERYEVKKMSGRFQVFDTQTGHNASYTKEGVKYFYPNWLDAETVVALLNSVEEVTNG